MDIFVEFVFVVHRSCQFASGAVLFTKLNRNGDFLFFWVWNTSSKRGVGVVSITHKYFISFNLQRGLVKYYFL